MSRFFSRIAGVAVASMAAVLANAGVYDITFVKLADLTGGTPANTAVYRADLSGLPISNILSIGILDSNSGFGGASGKFSGFDLDAIMLSNTNYTTAGQVQAATGLSAFNFNSSHTLFFPGTQRPPVDPNLFGSTGNIIDNSMATLGAFDANSTTGSSAFGFASLGDGGRIYFNLTGPVSTSGLYLYIGEVGDNGEVAAGRIFVSDERTSVPGPAAALPMAIGLGASLLRRRRK